VRIILDTGVVVAAMRSPAGASAEILRLVRQGNLVAVVGVGLALEYESVCRRPELRAASGLSSEEVEIFLGAVIAMMEPVKNHFLWRPQLSDPGDELVLETAINGRAQLLVTFNEKDFVAAKRFGIDVLLPWDTLKRVRQ
jgi:putative PIN family toxin of toxin-antitoxin system